MSRPFRRPARRAFTLLELIVVITVLGILAAILVPVVARVRTSARSTHCVSNLQQLGRAFALHAGEHHGCLPAPVDPAGEGTPWYAALHPYAGARWTDDVARIDSLFLCPALAAIDQVPTPDSIGYSMSAILGGSYSLIRPVPIASLTQPSRTVLVLEKLGSGSIVFPDAGSPVESFAAEYTAATDLQGCDRHGGSANYLFADGHVGHLAPHEAQSALK